MFGGEQFAVYSTVVCSFAHCGVCKRRPSLFHQFRSHRSIKRIRRFGPFISAKTGVRGAAAQQSAGNLQRRHHGV